MLLLLGLSVLLFGCDVATNTIEPTPDVTLEPTPEFIPTPKIIPTPEPTPEPTPTPEPPLETYSFDESLYSGYELTLRQNVQSWGLGNIVLTYKSLDKDYDWYNDQFSSSLHPSVNCGPASIEMVGRFIYDDYAFSTNDLRQKFNPLGGWWYGTDIEGALDLSEIEYAYTYIEDADSLKAIIDRGHIAILNNNMSFIPRNFNLDQRTNRFYGGVTGHYFVLKGYVETDQGTYFEVYDPYSYFMTYENTDIPKGKNRYYESFALMQSLTSWFRTAYEITGPKTDI